MAVGAFALGWWYLLQLGWVEAARNWLEQEQPWLARLLNRSQALLALVCCWIALRDRRSSPALLAFVLFSAAVMLLELRVSLLLGLLLALFAVVGLVARPWPNRAIMARCTALAGLAVGIDAVAG